MKIGIDIDNVISNFDEELLAYFLQKADEYGIKNKHSYIVNGMLDKTKEEVKKFYNDNIEEIVTHLKVVDEAKEYIHQLKNFGYEIYIISGRDNGEYKDPYGMTVNWLEQNDIEYDQLILTNAYHKSEKAKICEDNNISILIDDSIETLLEAAKINIIGLLMNTKYNQNNHDLKRVHSWKEIYDFIINEGTKKNVILDTDTNNECDDQFALSYLLKSQDIIKIDAITIAPYAHKGEVIKETTKKSQREVLKICRYFNFDTTNKVFQGSEGYLSNGYHEESDAVRKIIQIAKRNEKTYILAIGAITNVALAIKKEPEIVNKIEVIWLGGHSILQENNKEFNFGQDIEAARIVFTSKVKLTLIPCKNVASNLITSIYELNYYLKDKSDLANYLLDKFVKDDYHGKKERRVLWDISVVAYIINKQWFNTKEISCPKINDDLSYELTTNQHEIVVVNDIDVDSVYKDLFKKLGSIHNIEW